MKIGSRRSVPRSENWNEWRFGERSSLVIFIMRKGSLEKLAVSFFRGVSFSLSLSLEKTQSAALSFFHSRALPLSLARAGFLQRREKLFDVWSKKIKPPVDTKTLSEKHQVHRGISCPNSSRAPENTYAPFAGFQKKSNTKKEDSCKTRGGPKKSIMHRKELLVARKSAVRQIPL
jgi:hypothetical protein